MIRAVIDTNVLVSAALKDREPEAVILFVPGGMLWHCVRSARSNAKPPPVQFRRGLCNDGGNGLPLERGYFLSKAFFIFSASHLPTQ